jgi:hypothetical protein
MQENSTYEQPAVADAGDFNEDTQIRLQGSRVDNPTGSNAWFYPDDLEVN